MNSLPSPPWHSRCMNGATVTVTANNGRVTLSGMAQNATQSDIAQRDAKDVAGGRVIGFLSPGAG